MGTFRNSRSSDSKINECYQPNYLECESDSNCPTRNDKHMMCERCKKQIKGLFMSVGKTMMFHPECFSCTGCGKLIGLSAEYAKPTSNTLLCSKCSQMKSPKHTKRDINSTRKFTNSEISKAYVPRSYINGMQFDLFVDTRKRELEELGKLDPDELVTELFVKKVPERLNCGLFELQTEDRILEVEGVIIFNQSIDELQDLFAHLNSKMLNIVIERRVPGQAMTPNTPQEDKCLGNKSWVKESNDETIVGQPQIQRDPENRRAFHGRRGKSPVTAEQPPMSNHATLSKAPGYPTATQPLPPVPPEQTESPRTPSVKFSHSAPDPADSDDSTEFYSSQEQLDSDSDDDTSLTTRSETAILSVPFCEGKLESSRSLATGLSRIHSLRSRGNTSVRRKSQDGFCFRPSDLILGPSLGSGFFGQVFLVTDSITDKKYAMKELTRGENNSFKKEVSILKSLNHTNILRFIGVFVTEDDSVNLITEFVDGGTLNNAICKTVDFPWLHRIRIARDIAAGMDYLHEHNIIHRDLNSHNVLLRKDLTAVVADFGLARTVEGETIKPVNSIRFKSRRQCSKVVTKPITMGVKNIKRKMTIVGAMPWMAPEMMLDKLYNEMVDVYSFGIIICELLSRLNPDPDIILRNKDFIVDWFAFLPKLPANSPSPLIGLAQHATQQDSDYRPPFELSHLALEHLTTQMEQNYPVNLEEHDCLSLLY